MITKDLNVCLYPMKIVWDNIDYNLADLKEHSNTYIHRRIY